jgi:hypothetical protein
VDLIKIPNNKISQIERRAEDNGKRKTLVDLQAMLGAATVEFEPPRLGDEIVRATDLS